MEPKATGPPSSRNWGEFGRSRQGGSGMLNIKTRALLPKIALLQFTFLVLAALMTDSGTASAVERPFSFNTVVEKAKTLAANPYQAPEPIAEPLRALDYDSWRKVRFKPQQALWRKEKLPFELQFFPPGFLYDRTVKLNTVSGSKAIPLDVTADMFDFSQVQELKTQIPEALGAAGFRVHTAINTPSYLDEFLVFLGASYFRAVGKGQNYGLSARGLAVNTAQPEGEEFPWFREFWIQKPGKKDKELTLFALLDSESLTGAFSFKAVPGSETVIDVSCRLFLRNPVKTLGVAPLTGMFFYGENSAPNQRMDWRPEVHDSDGLLVHFRSGEWLWRPNQNPSYLLVNTFEANRVQGFGLLQRDTDFNNYQDLESRFENRPSVWIEPLENWGPGSVERVLIPSDQEIHDNLVAFWNPKEQADPGKPMSFSYRMRWFKSPDALPPGIRVTATRTSKPSPNERLFILDFAGTALAKLKADAGVDGIVSTGPGAKIKEQQSYKNPVTGGWRLIFRVAMDEGPVLENIKPDKRAPIELRAYLKLGDGSVSETWSYAITPER